MASGYNTALLGVQGSAQQASLTADQNANAYTLGLAGQSVAQNQTNIGAATSAAGAGLGAQSRGHVALAGWPAFSDRRPGPGRSSGRPCPP